MDKETLEKIEKIPLKYLIVALIVMIAVLTASIVLTIIGRTANATYISGNNDAWAEATFIISIRETGKDAPYQIKGTVFSESPTQRMLLIDATLEFESSAQAISAFNKFIFSKHAYFSSNIKASKEKKSGICRLRIHRNSYYNHLRPEQSVPQTIKDAIKEIASILGGNIETEPVVRMKKKKTGPPPNKNDAVKGVNGRESPLLKDSKTDPNGSKRSWFSRLLFLSLLFQSAPALKHRRPFVNRILKRRSDH